MFEPTIAPMIAAALEVEGWIPQLCFTIPHQAAAKGNSRQIAMRPRRGADGTTIMGRAIIKGPAAVSFMAHCGLHIPFIEANNRLDAMGMEVACILGLAYDRMASDVDGSLVYDAMQTRIIVNDNCITQKHEIRLYGDPRVECEVFARRWYVDGEPVKLKASEEFLKAERLQERERARIAREQEKAARKRR